MLVLLLSALLLTAPLYIGRDSRVLSLRSLVLIVTCTLLACALVA